MKSSAAKRSAGVALGVNLSNRLHAGDESSETKAAHSGFETHRRRHQKSKTGESMAPYKGLMSSRKILKKKKI